MTVTAKLHSQEFAATLRRYREFSSRDPASICNTKAYFISRGATRETPKSTKAQVKSDLMAEARKGGPLAALIVNKARKLAGLPGLAGVKMRKAIANLIKYRKVSTLAAGWIQAIKRLEPLASTKRGAPRIDRSAKEFGKPKGKAIPATNGVFITHAIIQNTAGALWDKRDSATAKAFPALQRAFDAEERSMREHIEDKMRETAHKAGIKHN